MIKKNHRVISIFSFLLSLAVSVSPVPAQGTCDYQEFRLEKINGRVVSDGPRGYEPIAKAKVELWRTGGVDEEDKLIVSTFADVNGYFEMGEIKKGLYRLDVSTSLSGFGKKFVGIKVVKKVKESERGKQLLFRLGVDACGGEVFLRQGEPNNSLNRTRNQHRSHYQH